MNSFPATFQGLNLNPLLDRAIKDLGFEKPSQIQAEALPILLGDATDFIGLAATGTGKTAAFAIPMLERIDPTIRAVQAVILCPTRELALQVAGQIDLLGKHLGVRALPIYGGSGYGDQINGLRRGAQVVVGTPGRLVDHIEKGTLRLDDLSTLILDEADEMISMGFKDDLEAILSKAPRDSSNIWLFSATMSGDVRRVADTYLTDPQQVQVNRTEMLPDTIEQLYYKVHEGDKPEILCKLVDAADDFYGLVFCQTKALVVDLTQYLKARGYAVDCLHGDMEQDARERTMKIFRDRRVKLLICTDVASRGLDVKDITHVINYSLPRELDNYVHRIGRTARSGKTGVAMSLVTPSHKGLISRIERMTKSRMFEGRIPSRKELGAKKVGAALTKFMDQPHHDRAVGLLSEEWKQSLSTMTVEEVAGRFLSAMYPEVFSERDLASERSERPARVVPANSLKITVNAPKRSAGVSPVIPRGVTVTPKISPVMAIAPGSTDGGIAGDSAPAAIESAPVTEVALTGSTDSEAPATTKRTKAEKAAKKAAATAAYEAKVAAKAAADAEAKKHTPSLTLESLESFEEAEQKAAYQAAKVEAASLKEVAPADLYMAQDTVEAMESASDMTMDSLDAEDADHAESSEETELEAAPKAKAVKVRKAKVSIGAAASGIAASGSAPLVAPLATPAPVRSYSDRKSYGDKPAYGERKSYGDKPSYGDRKPYGERRTYGDKPAFGDRKPFGERRSYGDKPSFGERKPFGERRTFGDKPAYGAPKSYEKREGFGKTPSPFGPPPKKKIWVRKPYGTEASSGPKPFGSAPREDDIGLGRAPQDRSFSSPWKSEGGKPGVKKAGGGFAKPAWGKDKPFRRPRQA